MKYDKTVLILTGCSCPKETDMIPPIETKCTSVSLEFDEEEQEWVVITGFLERCSRCKQVLDYEGWGDINAFPTRQEAEDFANQFHVGSWSMERRLHHDK